MGRDESHGESREAPGDISTRVFLDPDRLEFDASRAADAESRFKVIGMIEDKLYIVVATRRGGACRIISARRANRTEDRTYGSR